MVELWSDSKYVTDALSLGWAKLWRAKGWIKSDKKPALNPDLWERLLELTQTHAVTCHWVKGHADNPKNNRCGYFAASSPEATMSTPVPRMFFTTTSRMATGGVTLTV